MFDLNFIAEPGIQTKYTEASWSFLPKRTESETDSVLQSSLLESKKIGRNWKDYGIAVFAVIILVFLSMFVNSQPKVDQNMVLNQVIDLIIESGYIKDLQLTGAYFEPDIVKVTISTSELGVLQNFTQNYHKDENIPYEIFQKNELYYGTLNFPWESDKIRGDITKLKTLADKTVFSNRISISFTKNEFKLQGRSSDIISYLLQMADNGLIPKFSLLVQHLESDRFYIKVRTNKI